MKIAFDIDGTLIVPGKNFRQVPNYPLIQVMKWFIANGDDVFVWSGGGIDYAQTIVDRLGLTGSVKVIEKVNFGDCSNPHNIDISFDDCETKLAKVDVLVK
jgi:hydroxymethylpyrimidine pyrophosphatase-like HAD family hydrolase